MIKGMSNLDEKTLRNVEAIVNEAVDNVIKDRQMTDNTKPYFTSKSGKKCTIQHSSCWYQEHDTTQYNIFKVLVDSIPKGQPGHTRHCDALRTLKRFMKTARFGTATQIAYLLTVNNGAKQERVTYLLNKYQFLVMAAALSDEYLQLAVSVQHANLSAEELAMDSFEFMRMIKKQADTMLQEAINAETPSETIARSSAAMQLMEFIEQFEATEADFVDTTDPAYDLAVADAQVAAFQLDNAEYYIAKDYADLAKDRLHAAVSVREAVSVLLDSRVISDQSTVKEQRAMLKDLVERANAALSLIKGVAAGQPSAEEMAKHMLFNNTLISDTTTIVWLDCTINVDMQYALKRKGITATGPQYKNFCRDDLIEFGLYAVLYDRTAMMDHYYALCNEYKAKHGYTDQQIAHIFLVMNLSLPVPTIQRGVVLVEKLNTNQWRIYNMYR